jgi:hypothetical protein
MIDVCLNMGYLAVGCQEADPVFMQAIPSPGPENLARAEIRALTARGGWKGAGWE